MGVGVILIASRRCAAGADDFDGCPQQEDTLVNGKNWLLLIPFVLIGDQIGNHIRH